MKSFIHALSGCIYLLYCCGGAAQEGAPEAGAAGAFDGQWQYDTYCATCHGFEGEGFYPFGVPLRGNALVLNAPGQVLIPVIQEGRYDGNVVYPRYSGMPPFEYLRAGQVQAIIDYMKTGLQQGGQ